MYTETRSIDMFAMVVADMLVYPQYIHFISGGVRAMSIEAPSTIRAVRLRYWAVDVYGVHPVLFSLCNICLYAPNLNRAGETVVRVRYWTVDVCGVYPVLFSHITYVYMPLILMEQSICEAKTPHAQPHVAVLF